MPVQLHKPDNVLKRAQEFIDVGKEDRALEALANLLKSRTSKIWQKTPEKILFDYFNKFLELCVKLRKSDVAKEGLYHYRNICQQVNVNALEIVFRKFLETAEAKTAEAAKESNVKIDIEDLDVIQSPEELLLNAVGGGIEKNNSILTPWLKFLWEAYRQCLDLLRNNNLVQNLYHDIANQTFKFCLEYSRKTEFRKISENLRNHLLLLQKQNTSTIAIDLNNPETQNLHLNTRFNQLDIAITMELWQEAFKIVQDLYGLMQISKKQVKAQVRANYYKKLALVFWKAENNHLFHACALHRLFALLKDSKKNFTVEDSQKMCILVVIATLSIPMPPSKNDIERIYDNNDKNRKLAALLGLTIQPTRQALINDLITNNILNNVPLELQNFYNWLEKDFHPLKLIDRVTTSLDHIRQEYPDLVKYIPFLQEVALFKLLQQVAQVFESITFEKFCLLANILGPQEIERFVVDAAKNNDIQVRIDHRKRLLLFGTDYSISERDDTTESPQLQPLPTDVLRCQLMTFTKCLDQSIELINPPETCKRSEVEQLFWVKRFKEEAPSDFVAIDQRLQAIEVRKKKLGDLQKKEKQPKPKVEFKDIGMRRETDFKEKEKMTIDGQAVKRVETQSKPSSAPPEPSLIQELEVRRKNEIKMSQELQARLKSQFRKIDHLARAIHQEEANLLEAHVKTLMTNRKNEWEELEKIRVKAEIEAFHFGLKEKERIHRMKSDVTDVLEKLKEFHKPHYEEAAQQFEIDLVNERKKRLEARALERKREREAKFRAEIKDRMTEQQKQQQQYLKQQEQQQQQQDNEPNEIEDGSGAQSNKTDYYVPPSKNRIQREYKLPPAPPSMDRDNRQMPPRYGADRRTQEGGMMRREPFPQHQQQTPYQPPRYDRYPDKRDQQTRPYPAAKPPSYNATSSRYPPNDLVWKKAPPPNSLNQERYNNSMPQQDGRNDMMGAEDNSETNDYSNPNEWRTTTNRKFTNRNY